MESTEEDMKPTIPADNMPDKSPLTASGVGKLKHSRYEDVWPEDVHAAFMEAIALYPPMGKRRLKYYRVSTYENVHFSNVNRAKSFGRCQLIQSYILEKTGKNRSRKQVSSHLQRLKKIHKDNPAMLPLFSECSQPPSERSSASQVTATTSMSSQDTSTNTSVSTRHLKSDPDLPLNLQNTDTGALGSSTFSYGSEASSLNSTSFFPPQEFLSPVPQQCLAGALHPCDSDYLSELRDALLFKDAMNEGFRSAGGSAFNASAFSISMRRLASRLPIQGRLMDSGPTTHLTHFPHAVNTPGSLPTHQWISHDDSMDAVSCNSPFTSVEEAFNMPFFPLQLIPSEKRLDPGLASEWTWPKNPDILLDPRGGSFDEIRLRYPPVTYQYNPELRLGTPGSHGSLSEYGLTRGISYSYPVASPATVTESVSNDGGGSPESSENLASPFLISPIPVYPISYIHSDIHSNIHSDDRTPAPSLPP